MFSDMTFSFLTRVRVRVVAAVLVMTPAIAADAQSVRPQELETRAALIERAAREDRAGRKATAASIRARLENGDYQEGDRVIILLENMPGSGRGDLALIRPDTLSVRAGRILQFPQARYRDVTDLRIGGLLRSELPDSVRVHFLKTYRDPQVRVTSLIALSVAGAVMRGGTVDVPGDMRLNDIFNVAGGLAGEVDMKKSSVRRGAQEIMTGKELQQAIDNGLTVDAAQLRAGDQINVARKTPSNWLTYVGLGMSVLTVVIALATRGS